MYMMKLSIACRQNFRRWQHLLSANKMFNNKSYPSWNAKLVSDQIFGTDFMHTSLLKPNSNVTYASSRASFSTAPPPEELSTTIVDVNVDVRSRYVNVTFNNGTVDTYPFTWLRDNCQCERCYEPNSQSRTILLKDLDIETVPKSVSVKLLHISH